MNDSFVKLEGASIKCRTIVCITIIFDKVESFF
jgi:hypothetical protein